MNFELIGNVKVGSIDSWKNKLFLTLDMDWCKEKMIILVDAEFMITAKIILHEVGQIASSNTNSSVITGNGKLKINEVEYDGFIGKPKNKIKSIRKRLK